jgi:uncharacterized protein (DUF1501 family)
MISRRVFLKDGAFALVSLGFAPSFLARTALAANAAGRAKRLVAIFQRGGCDGLSVVLPFGDPAYYRARPSLAIAPPAGAADAAIDLDGFFGFNPRLEPLVPFWKAGQLAVVHACGSPDATRSHFDAQDYLETGTPGVRSTADGWLNRYLQTRADEDRSQFRAVAVARQLPRMLKGPAAALAIPHLSQFDVRGGFESFESVYAGSPDRVINATARSAFEAIRRLRAADPAGYRPGDGADYPRSPFGESLQQIAQLVKSDLGLEVAYAEIGGWDTHVNQGVVQGQLANRLDDFARGLAALVRDLGDGIADTVIVTMSEFGRAVDENGGRGTDHGHGNAMFVIGGGVRGGRVYGRWPGLAVEQRHDRRDLAITTDFRDVFAEIVVRHLGATAVDKIFPGYPVNPSRFPGLLA